MGTGSIFILNEVDLIEVENNRKLIPQMILINTDTDSVDRILIFRKFSS